MKWSIFGIVFVFFVVLYCLILCRFYPVWRSDKQLALKGISTVAVVTEKLRMNHQAIRYSYRANSDSYIGQGPTGVGGVPAFDKIKVGDQIAIRYSPENPNISLPGDPRYLFQSWSGLLFICLPLMVVLLSIATGLWLSKLCN